MLALHLSDVDKILYRHTLGDEERSCVSPMSVIIMGADICRWTGFGFMQRMIVDALGAVRRGQMDVSDAKSPCWRTRVKDIPSGPPGLRPLARPSGIFHQRRSTIEILVERRLG